MTKDKRIEILLKENQDLREENRRQRTEIEILTIKLNNAGERYIKLIDEYEQKFKDIQKAWITFENIEGTYNDYLWAVDKLIMNR